MEQASTAMFLTLTLFYIAWVPMCAIQALFLQEMEVTWPNADMRLIGIRPGDVCAYVGDALGTPADCSSKCFRIKRSRRWGNNLVQLIHAARLAQFVEHTHVFIPMGFLFLTAPIMWNGSVEISPHGKRVSCTTAGFWKLFRHLGFVNVHEVPDDFRLEYLRRLNVTRGSSSTLSIHVRAGDIFVAPNKLYGQPPCVYYRDIVSMRRWDEVVIVAEDLGNPCVTQIAENATLRLGNTLQEDLTYLLGAQNLVIGRGTFGAGVYILSMGIRNLFAYGRQFEWGMYPRPWYVENKMNCVPTPEYEYAVLGMWKGKPQQIHMMTTANVSCKEWVKDP